MKIQIHSLWPFVNLKSASLHAQERRREKSNFRRRSGKMPREKWNFFIVNVSMVKKRAIEMVEEEWRRRKKSGKDLWKKKQSTIDCCYSSSMCYCVEERFSSIFDRFTLSRLEQQLRARETSPAWIEKQSKAIENEMAPILSSIGSLRPSCGLCALRRVVWCWRKTFSTHLSLLYFAFGVPSLAHTRRSCWLCRLLIGLSLFVRLFRYIFPPLTHTHTLSLRFDGSSSHFHLYRSRPIFIIIMWFSSHKTQQN